jgi:hypothetical protein
MEQVYSICLVDVGHAFYTQPQTVSRRENDGLIVMFDTCFLTCIGHDEKVVYFGHEIEFGFCNEVSL